jgi:hypothetical protein
MVIQCTLSVSLQSIWDYANKIERLPPLPRYIIKRSAYIKQQETLHQIIILYKFDKSNFPEAMEYICKQLDSWHDVSEFFISVLLSGFHPCYLPSEKGGGLPSLN